MILYKNTMTINKRERPDKKIKIVIDELPQRSSHNFKTPKEKAKYIKTCENVIRKSLEYKGYIKFLKDNVDMNACSVFKKIKSSNGIKYSIEIHHEPFTLFDIVETVINKKLAYGESLNSLEIADEVMQLHYDGMIGLLPLSVTAHELVHNDRIFIPLQYVYQNYNKFYDEYSEFINPTVASKIEAKVDLSLRTEGIVSDSLDVEFIYMEIDGFNFPTIPPEWEHILSISKETDISVEPEDKESPE